MLGFVIEGTDSKPVLIRAVGPGLTGFGVTGVMTNPSIEVFDSNSISVAANDDWAGDSTVAALSHSLGALPLESTSADAALIVSLAPGAYTAHVKGGPGKVIPEVFDGASPPQTATRLLNIFLRADVRSDEPLLGGIVVAGDIPETVLIRGIGPTLGTFGRTGILLNPVLTVFDLTGNIIATNANWNIAANLDLPSAAVITSTAQTVGAPPFRPIAVPRHGS